MPYKLSLPGAGITALIVDNLGYYERTKPMRRFVLAAFVITSIAVSPMSAALAHEGQDHPVVAGKVTKVDASAGKITIAHDAIPNLQMEAMTMVFKAGDPAMVNEVKPGDAIKFTADKVNGELTVTEIDKAR